MDSTRELSPVLLFQGLRANRARPDLEALARERRPERFVWQMLPHAARSFAASIVMLPRRQARAAAVAYLYCRMLDTYEDMFPDPAARMAELERFGNRFGSDPLPAPTPIPPDLVRSDRDRVHLLLVDRCELVDAVYATLDSEVRASIAELVGSMSEGMIWSTDAFARQGGVLLDAEQLARYCRNVIGLPAVFLLELVRSDDFTDPVREDALQVSEMVQMANVTRDIEADLERGVAYHPALRPLLGAPVEGAEARASVSAVRRELIGIALSRAPAYRRMYEGLGLGRGASVRTAAVLMLAFTSLHYRRSARSAGHAPWPRPRGRLEVIGRALPSLLSRRWANRVLASVERDFMRAASVLLPPST